MTVSKRGLTPSFVFGDRPHRVLTDKGYGSNTNWDDMLRNNMSFICNARRNLNGAVTDIIDENYAALLNWNNGVSYLKQNAVTVPIVWHYDEFPVAGNVPRSRRRRRFTFICTSARTWRTKCPADSRLNCAPPWNFIGTNLPN